MSSQTFQDFLRRDSRLAQLGAEAQQRLALDRAFRKLLPEPLQACCQAAGINQGELVVFAHTGIAAARLRMLGPSLLPALSAAGHAADRLRIRVSLQPVRRSRPKGIGFTPGALDCIAASVASVPHPDVRAALENLVARHRR